MIFLGEGREGSWLPQVPWGPARRRAELTALISALFLFKTSIQNLPCQSVFSWLLTTFSLFDLLNVCFSSVFHTCSDSLPFPRPRDICQAVTSNGPAWGAAQLTWHPHSSSLHHLLPSRMQMPRQWRELGGDPSPANIYSGSFTQSRGPGIMNSLCTYHI